MKLGFTSLLLACFVSSCAAPSRAPIAGADHAPLEEQAILATLDRFFEAMNRRDVAAYSALILEDGMTYTQAQDAGGWKLQRRSQLSLAQALGQGRGAPVETYWRPTVLVRGPIAVVWTPYRFTLDGVETHRGVDVFDMVKLDGRWRIANALWTRESGADLLAQSPDEVRPTSLRDSNETPPRR